MLDDGLDLRRAEHMMAVCLMSSQLLASFSFTAASTCSAAALASRLPNVLSSAITGVFPIALLWCESGLRNSPRNARPKPGPGPKDVAQFCSFWGQV